MKRFLALTLVLVSVLSLFAACTQQPGSTTGSTGSTGAIVKPTTTAPVPTVPPTTAPSDPWDEYDCLTVAEAIAICEQTGTTQLGGAGLLTDSDGFRHGEAVIFVPGIGRCRSGRNGGHRRCSSGFDNSPRAAGRAGGGAGLLRAGGKQAQHRHQNQSQC